VNIVFLGTPRFAVPTLERLLAGGHDVVAVVTQPDRRRGRGQIVSASPVKTTAVAHGVSVLQPDTLKDPEFFSAFQAWNPDLAVVAAYGKLIPDDLLNLPRHGMINVHASLLPAYRGAAPIHRAVMAGERRTGITIIKLVHAMDAGPMLSHAAVPIGPDDTSEVVEHALATVGADLLASAVEDIAHDRAVFQEQDHTQATLARRIARADGIVDWSRTAESIHNQIRGLYPWPHAFSFVNGKRVLLRRSAVETRPTATGTEPIVAHGEILVASRDRLVVAAGRNTALGLLELQPEGKRPLAAHEFLAGRPLTTGTRFTSSVE